MGMRRSSAGLQCFLNEPGTETMRGEQLVEKVKLRQYQDHGVGKRSVTASAGGQAYVCDGDGQMTTWKRCGQPFGPGVRTCAPHAVHTFKAR